MGDEYELPCYSETLYTSKCPGQWPNTSKFADVGAPLAQEEISKKSQSHVAVEVIGSVMYRTFTQVTAVQVLSVAVVAVPKPNRALMFSQC